jgi:hypothetical protein
MKSGFLKQNNIGKAGVEIEIMLVYRLFEGWHF